MQPGFDDVSSQVFFTLDTQMHKDVDDHWFSQTQNGLVRLEMCARLGLKLGHCLLYCYNDCHHHQFEPSWSLSIIARNWVWGMCCCHNE